MSDIVERAKAALNQRWEPGSPAGYLPHLIAEVERLRPRIVTTFKELDALPHGSVVRSKTSRAGEPCVWQRIGFDWYTPAIESADEPYLPALVLWTPEDGEK